MIKPAKPQNFHIILFVDWKLDINNIFGISQMFRRKLRKSVILTPIRGRLGFNSYGLEGTFLHNLTNIFSSNLSFQLI